MNIKQRLRKGVFILFILIMGAGAGISGGIPIPIITKEENPTELVEIKKDDSEIENMKA